MARTDGRNPDTSSGPDVAPLGRSGGAWASAEGEVVARFTGARGETTADHVATALEAAP
jgi:hypothetical protein